MSAVEVGRALEKLVSVLADTEWTDIAEDVQKRAALVMCDDLGAIVAARGEPEVLALHDGIAGSAGAGEATVFNGRGHHLDRYSAALANGCAGDWAELDEGYRRVICHAGPYIAHKRPLNGMRVRTRENHGCRARNRTYRLILRHAPQGSDCRSRANGRKAAMRMKHQI